MLALQITIKKIQNMLTLKISVLALLFFFSANAYADIVLKKIKTTEDEIVLTNILLNRSILFNALDGYLSDGKLLIAVEPLFDTLTLRYQLFDDRIVVWKDDVKITLLFSNDNVNQTTPNLAAGTWASDDYYLYIDTETIASIFDVSIEFSSFHMSASITTNNYLFPKQKLEILADKRTLSKINHNNTKKIKQTIPITIPDQYRLITVPHGQINSALWWNNQKRDNNFNLQLTSDLLYHSANLTMSKANDADLISRMQFSRYKSKPDELILGAFDNYNFGDVSGFSTKLTTRTNAGLGITFNRSPNSFRHQNQSITLKHTAPPGWEAELYHNNRFIISTNVPEDGLLIFDDVNTEYGQNYYQIKLFSPYGEEKVIEEYFDLTKNALSKGDFAYSLFAFDNKHQLLNDSSSERYSITDLGATLDYGISDNWQFGVGYSISNNDTDSNFQQLNLKNSLSLPGLLFENNLSIADNSGFAQNSTLIGNGFGSDRISLSYLSAHNFQNSRIYAKEFDFHQVSAGYSGYLKRINYLFNVKYLNALGKDNWGISNRLSTSIDNLYLSNTLTYSFDENRGNSGLLNNNNKERVTGDLGIGGRITDNLRLTGQVSYSPLDSQLIQNNSSIALQWKLKDTFGADHYLSGRYNPLIKTGNKWSINHNVAWTNKNYSLTFTANYNAENNWNFQAGIRFFLGYDYYNNRPLFSSEISNRSATLNAHTYLDRQLNGTPDPLDYNLANVSFQGNEAWKNITSGDTGKTILPGVMPNNTFKFGAKWQVGSETINNDYVVYTHSGAYVDANIPFYLSSEFTGFVVREKGGIETPLANVLLELIDSSGKIFKTSLTDIDGYYEFFKLPPQPYKIKVSQHYLTEKGYTSNIIGFKLPMIRSGGFVELDTIALNRSSSESELGKEELVLVQYTPDNSEPIVWDDDENIRQDYFLLPTNSKTNAKHTLSVNEISKNSNNMIPEIKPIEVSNPQAEVSDETINLLSEIATKEKRTVTFSAVKTSLIKAQSSTVKLKKITNPKEKPTTKDQHFYYTVQLGAFYTIEEASKLANSFSNNIKSKIKIIEDKAFENVILLSVTYGNYNSKKEALAEAKLIPEFNHSYYVKRVESKSDDNLKTINTLSKNKFKQDWLIQFYAGKDKISATDILKYQNYNKLFLAEKSVNNTTELYCIVSQTFSSKSEAIEALSRSGVAGWVTTATPYSITQSLN